MSTATIFISSTFLDLRAMRAEVAEWLSEVFGADLIIMETFGSDADPPEVTSVRRVRECDFFVGIYANRYGTFDAGSGKSITELELDEAERSYSAGIIRDILLYVLDSSSSWPVDYSELTELGRQRLANLKLRAQGHTCTHFKTKDELLLFVTRDIHRKLLEHIQASPLRIRK